MATSAAQIAASKANAAHSTGPVSAVGKEKVSSNAISHGLTSTRLLLPGESKEDFEALCQTVAARYDIQTRPETGLVVDLATAEWRAARAWRVHDSFLAMTIEADESRYIQNASAADILANSIHNTDNTRRLSLILRYIRAAERAVRTTADSLSRVIKARHAGMETSERAQRRPVTARRNQQPETRTERRARERAERKAARKIQWSPRP
ncbi:MAG: hypothetical protein SGI92_11460 [Bryobacteraceae bacterium]|nr:hypothetical protein [Bryobacteraceae bacterium]